MRRRLYEQRLQLTDAYSRSVRTFSFTCTLAITHCDVLSHLGHGFTRCSCSGSVLMLERLEPGLVLCPCQVRLPALRAASHERRTNMCRRANQDGTHSPGACGVPAHMHTTAAERRPMVTPTDGFTRGRPFRSRPKLCPSQCLGGPWTVEFRDQAIPHH